MRGFFVFGGLGVRPRSQKVALVFVLVLNYCRICRKVFTVLNMLELILGAIEVDALGLGQNCCELCQKRFARSTTDAEISIKILWHPGLVFI